MLSDHLRHLRDFLDPYRHTGAEVAPEAMVSILANLNAAIGKAQDLEACSAVSAANHKGSAKGKSAKIILFPACARFDHRMEGGAA